MVVYTENDGSAEGSRTTNFPKALLIEGLAREGVPHEFVRVRGGGHGQGAGFDTGALDPVVAAFLGKHLT